MDRHPALAHQALTDFCSSLRQMEIEVTNVWMRQIETGRKHSEESITDLANRFEAIVRKLDATLAATDDTASSQQHTGNAFVVLQQGEHKLHAVVASLEQSMSHKDELLSEVKGLSSYVSNLQEMAEAVSSLATQTNMLALNAAIEAAHAGERGKGFAVVASQVRALSQESKDTGRRIHETIKVISDAITNTFGKAETFAIEDTSRVQEAKHNIDGVLGDFRQLTGYLEDNATTLRQSATGIKADIAESLVLLQFQDRVSQILSHVRDNIGLLPGHLDRYLQDYTATGTLAAIDWSGLMQELMNTYATQEEFINHDQRTTTTRRAAGTATASRSLTFF